MKFQRRQLDVLVAIADHGSIHRAAQHLGVAQPAVSRMLAVIETTVGARLFERLASGCVATPRGQALLAHSRVLLRALERLDAAGRGEPSTVRFGCIPRAMHTLMPAVIRQMQPGNGSAAAPYRLQVVENSSTALLEAIRRADLDFAVMRHVGGAAGIGRDLDAQRLYEERPLVVAGVRHPLARRRQLTLSSLLDHAWSLPAAQTTSRAVFDRFCQEQGLGIIRPVLETRSFDSSVAVVAGSDLLALIPESLARHYERAGMVRVLPVWPPLPCTPVLLVADPRSAEDPTLGDFRRLVLEAARSAREFLSLPA